MHLEKLWTLPEIGSSVSFRYISAEFPFVENSLLTPARLWRNDVKKQITVSVLCPKPCACWFHPWNFSHSLCSHRPDQQQYAAIRPNRSQNWPCRRISNNRNNALAKCS